MNRLGPQGPADDAAATVPPAEAGAGETANSPAPLQASDWTRDDVLVYFTADEWDEITSALRSRAPTSPTRFCGTCRRFTLTRVSAECCGCWQSENACYCLPGLP